MEIVRKFLNLQFFLIFVLWVILLLKSVKSFQNETGNRFPRALQEEHEKPAAVKLVLQQQGKRKHGGQTEIEKKAFKFI